MFIDKIFLEMVMENIIKKTDNQKAMTRSLQVVVEPKYVLISLEDMKI